MVTITRELNRVFFGNNKDTNKAELNNSTQSNAVQNNKNKSFVPFNSEHLKANFITFKGQVNAAKEETNFKDSITSGILLNLKPDLVSSTTYDKTANELAKRLSTHRIINLDYEKNSFPYYAEQAFTKKLLKGDYEKFGFDKNTQVISFDPKTKNKPKELLDLCKSLKNNPNKTVIFVDDPDLSGKYNLFEKTGEILGDKVRLVRGLEISGENTDESKELDVFSTSPFVYLPNMDKAETKKLLLQNPIIIDEAKQDLPVRINSIKFTKGSLDKILSFVEVNDPEFKFPENALSFIQQELPEIVSEKIGKNENIPQEIIVTGADISKRLKSLGADYADEEESSSFVKQLFIVNDKHYESIASKIAENLTYTNKIILDCPENDLHPDYLVSSFMKMSQTGAFEKHNIPENTNSILTAGVIPKSEKAMLKAICEEANREEKPLVLFISNYFAQDLDLSSHLGKHVKIVDIINGQELMENPYYEDKDIDNTPMNTNTPIVKLNEPTKDQAFNLLKNNPNLYAHIGNDMGLTIKYSDDGLKELINQAEKNEGAFPEKAILIMNLVTLRAVADKTHETGGKLDEIVIDGKDVQRIMNENPQLIIPSVTSPTDNPYNNYSKNYLTFVPTKTFDDVGGMEDVKEDLKIRLLNPLKDPAKYKQMGAKIPKGVLLYGPPGTGKSLLAEAIAGEAQVPYIPVSGSDFVKIFAGSGSNNVDELFKTAIKQAEEHPSKTAIIGIDEFDALARSRNNSAGGSDEGDNTLMQFLSYMDGAKAPTHVHITVIATTNRKDLLDEASIRSGRFDIEKEIKNVTSKEGKKKILDVHTRNKPFKTNEEKQTIYNYLLNGSNNLSPADLSATLNNAALIAAGRKADYIEMKDIEAGLKEVKTKSKTNKIPMGFQLQQPSKN
jgi:ATP-dependent 26S proteasome regulatory subunit